MLPDTLACGTVRSNRPMLALKWCDKSAVYILSTMHAALQIPTGKKCRSTGNPIYKPSAIVDYTNKMGGVDLCDQLMGYYHFLWPTVKWWWKLWVHELNMLIMNAYILHQKFGNGKMSHSAFWEKIAHFLIETSQNENTELHREIHIANQEHFEVARLHGKHFWSQFPKRTAKEVSHLFAKCVLEERNLWNQKDFNKKGKVLYSIMTHVC